MTTLHRVFSSKGLGLLAMAIVMASVMAACSTGAGAAVDNTPLAGVNSGQTQALGSGLASGSAASQGGSQGITVSGVGVVKVKPDLAVLSLGVEAIADTVSEARTMAAERMSAMLAALKAAGVAEEDIETQGFQIWPQYEPYANQSRLSGFQVRNMLTVKVRDLDRVGEVIDRAVEAGGDTTRVNNIEFTAEEGGEAENEARRLALKDAVAKANLYAAEMGLSRGSLLSLRETSGSRFPEFAVRSGVAMAESLAPTPIQPGALDVMVHVEAVFAIGS